MTAGDSLRTRVVRAAVAPMHGESKVSAPLVSQVVFGHQLELLTSNGVWCGVRSDDGYQGWVHSGYLFGESHSAESTPVSDWLHTTGCTIEGLDGRPLQLPYGARFSADRTVVEGEHFSETERAQKFPTTAHAIAHSACTFFTGASYLWGGLTPWGCDCSGFVQAILRMHGVLLPRDAYQQAAHGEPVGGVRHGRPAAQAGAPKVNALASECGDLLFFSDRDDHRITHVGLRLAGSGFVHSAVARGGVIIEQLDSDDPYVHKLRAQCVAIRRVVR